MSAAPVFAIERAEETDPQLCAHDPGDPVGPRAAILGLQFDKAGSTPSTAQGAERFGRGDDGLR